NSLRLSLSRVDRPNRIERRTRKIGIAATTKAIILKIIAYLHCSRPTCPDEDRREPTSVTGDPIVRRIPDQTAEHRYIEERHLPPQSRHAQHHVAIGREARQSPSVGQDEIERLLHVRIADHRGRIGAKIPRLDLLKPIEGEKPGHRSEAKA